MQKASMDQPKNLTEAERTLWKVFEAKMIMEGLENEKNGSVVDPESAITKKNSRLM